MAPTHMLPRILDSLWRKVSYEGVWTSVCHTNRGLCAAVHKGLHGVSIHFNGNTARDQQRVEPNREPHILQHRHTAKDLRRVLERMFEVLHNRLLPYRLFYPALCLDVEWVCLHGGKLALCLDVARTRLAQELCEPVGVRLRGMS